jgi:hypothetical protein
MPRVPQVEKLRHDVVRPVQAAAPSLDAASDEACGLPKELAVQLCRARLDVRSSPIGRRPLQFRILYPSPGAFGYQGDSVERAASSAGPYATPRTLPDASTHATLALAPVLQGDVLEAGSGVVALPTMIHWGPGGKGRSVLFFTIRPLYDPKYFEMKQVHIASYDPEVQYRVDYVIRKLLAEGKADIGHHMCGVESLPLPFFRRQSFSG